MYHERIDPQQLVHTPDHRLFRYGLTLTPNKIPVEIYIVLTYGKG